MKHLNLLIFLVALVIASLQVSSTPGNKSTQVRIETNPVVDFGVRIYRKGDEYPLVDNISFGSDWTQDVAMPKANIFPLDIGLYTIQVFAPGYQIAEVSVDLSLESKIIQIPLTRDPHWTEILQLHSKDFRSTYGMSFEREQGAWVFVFNPGPINYRYNLRTKTLGIIPKNTPPATNPDPFSATIPPQPTPVYSAELVDRLLKIQARFFPDMPILENFSILDQSPSSNKYVVTGTVIGPRIMIFVIDSDKGEAYLVNPTTRYEKLISAIKWLNGETLYLFHEHTGIESYSTTTRKIETVVPALNFWLSSGVALFAPDLSYLVTVGGPGTGLWTYDLTDALKTAN